MSNPQLRYFINRDVPQVAAIERAACPDPWTADELMAVRRFKNVIGVVADDGNAILGYLTYELQPDRLEIIRLVVAPEFQRRGIGKLLIGKVVDKLQQRRDHADIVLDDRHLPVGHQFIAACGFTREATTRGPEFAEYEYVLRVGSRAERPEWVTRL